MSFRINFFIEEEKKAQGQISYDGNYLSFHFTNTEKDKDGVEFATRHGSKFQDRSDNITETLQDLAYFLKPKDSLDSDSESSDSDNDDAPQISQENGYHLKFEIIKKLSAKDAEKLSKSIEETKFFTKETIENLKHNFNRVLKQSPLPFYHSPGAQTIADREFTLMRRKR